VSDERRPSLTATVRAVIGRMILIGSLVAATAGCDGSDEDGSAGADRAWCQQLDVAVTASTGADGAGADDTSGEVDEDARSELDALADLDAPAAIADDWAVVSGPPPTSETGAFDLGGDWAEAGDRVLTWAVENCDLSEDARAQLTDRLAG
jgi:hypothetical protein